MKSDYDARKMTMRQLAKRFSISVSTVANIIHGRYWKS
jgi:transcriptional regulator with XRE-family HTH domain